jgi:hypothetical protein
MNALVSGLRKKDKNYFHEELQLIQNLHWSLFHVGNEDGRIE